MSSLTNPPVYNVVVGESLPSLAIWAFTDNVLLTGADFSYTLTVRTVDDDGNLFTKASGFVGQTGTGTGRDIDDIPNVLVAWESVGELDLLTAGRSHKASLAYSRLSDNKTGYFPLVIRAVATTG